MSLSTYSDLKSSIANWLNRDDLSNEIPDFIDLAENRIMHEVRLPTMEKTVLLNVSTSGYATIPNDFLEMKDVFWNYKPLERVSLTEFHRYEGQQGTPMYFTRETFRLKFFPTPTQSSDDVMRMIYYYDVGRLSDTDSTNILFSTAPELYLYAALSEAATFLGTDASRWEAKYQKAFARLIKHTRDSEVAGSSPCVSTGY